MKSDRLTKHFELDTLPTLIATIMLCRHGLSRLFVNDVHTYKPNSCDTVDFLFIINSNNTMLIFSIQILFFRFLHLILLRQYIKGYSKAIAELCHIARTMQAVDTSPDEKYFHVDSYS